jgi:hypothetical protein
MSFRRNMQGRFLERFGDDGFRNIIFAERF